MYQTMRRLKWRLDPVLHKLGYTLEKTRVGGPSFLTQLLTDRLQSPREIVFVQIGANDGISTDPLHPLITAYPGQFRGLVVEPLRDKFTLLAQGYADVPAITPVNMAIHNTETHMIMHRVRPDVEKTMPNWARGIGSFNPDYHKLSQVDSASMSTETVACTTFAQLVTQHNMDNLELLITDTEGYDYDILRDIDFHRFRPTYIQFEHNVANGVMSWERYKEIMAYLTTFGYSIAHEGSDATAFLPAALLA